MVKKFAKLFWQYCVCIRCAVFAVEHRTSTTVLDGFCWQVLQQMDLHHKVQGSSKTKVAFSLLCVLKLSKAQLNTKACRVSSETTPVNSN